MQPEQTNDSRKPDGRNDYKAMISALCGWFYAGALCILLIVAQNASKEYTEVYFEDWPTTARIIIEFILYYLINRVALIVLRWKIGMPEDVVFIAITVFSILVLFYLMKDYMTDWILSAVSTYIAFAASYINITKWIKNKLVIDR